MNNKFPCSSNGTKYIFLFLITLIFFCSSDDAYQCTGVNHNDHDMVIRLVRKMVLWEVEFMIEKSVLTIEFYD